MFRFPWGDMHSLNLGWFLQKFNELREDWATAEAGIDGALDAEIEKAEDALSDVFAARDAAAASATAAAGSASTAGTSATAAQNSATAAASSATLANNKATAAGLSEAAAAQSATQAGNSATAAAGSATAAGQSATNAAASETAAGNSASAAAASAAAAAGSATAAATSETNAAASASAAAASAALVDGATVAAISKTQPSVVMPYENLLNTTISGGGAEITILRNIIRFNQLTAAGNAMFDFFTGDRVSTTITAELIEQYGISCPDNIFAMSKVLETNKSSGNYSCVRVYFYTAADTITFREFHATRPQFSEEKAIITDRSSTNKKIMITVFVSASSAIGDDSTFAILVDNTSATTLDAYTPFSIAPLRPDAITLNEEQEQETK